MNPDVSEEIAMEFNSNTNNVGFADKELLERKNKTKVSNQYIGDFVLQLNPAGVSYRICIVVQMHPQFITEVDRTICPSCYYREAIKDVQKELEVR